MCVTCICVLNTIRQRDVAVVNLVLHKCHILVGEFCVVPLREVLKTSRQTRTPPVADFHHGRGPGSRCGSGATTNRAATTDSCPLEAFPEPGRALPVKTHARGVQQFGALQGQEPDHAVVVAERREHRRSHAGLVHKVQGDLRSA